MTNKTKELREEIENKANGKYEVSVDFGDQGIQRRRKNIFGVILLIWKYAGGAKVTIKTLKQNEK